MKKETIIWLSISAILVGSLSFFIYDLYKKPKNSNSNSDNEISEDIDNPIDYTIEESTTGNSSSGLYTNQNFPFGKGSGGPRILALQKFINKYSNKNLTLDGKFGPNTEKEWLNIQLQDIIINTNTPAWINYKKTYPNAVAGKVDEQFYNSNVKSYE